MRRKNRAVFALAVLFMSAVPAMSARAEGWVQERGGWAYYNRLGNRVTYGWQKGQDGAWRYLGANGLMAVNSWVDNEDYYVDSNGVMAVNTWIKVADSAQASGYDCYYVGETGKRVREKWREIDGNRYYFDYDGLMQTGWILDNMYYCNGNGVMQTGWQKLPAPEDEEEEPSGPETDYSDGTYWYYFGSSGKKTVPSGSGTNEKQKKINGVYYCLNENGALQTGWVCVTGDDSDRIEDYRLVDENGQVRTGWYSAYPPEDLQSQYDYDVEWFYFNSKGVPETGPEKGSAGKNDMIKIKGNTYLFDANGTPVFGIQRVYTDREETDYTAYYFGTRSQSCLQKGKVTIDEGGERVPYYFGSGGAGYTGVHDSYLYYMGRLQKADPENRYEVFTIPSGNGSKNYVVNTSGKIVKNTTVKDRSDTKYTTNSSGVLQEIDGETVGEGSFTSPQEPDWSAFD